MSERPIFRHDLYRGTARFYDEFRLRYPPVLIDDLCRRTGVTGRGRLLDLACGPGTVTFALSDRFAEVCAVDLEPEAIELAAHKAAELGVRNVRWTAGRAEDVDPDERFDLVTIGTAFHRLDRRRVAALAVRWLRSGGSLALLWASTPIEGTERWNQLLATIVVDWMQRVDASDVIPANFADDIRQHPHAAVLADAGFDTVEHYEFSETNEWTVESLLGLFYSTSLLSRSVLGDRVGEFEADVRARLSEIEPSGTFREQTSFAYDLAYRPPDPAA